MGLSKNQLEWLDSRERAAQEAKRLKAKWNAEGVLSAADFRALMVANIQAVDIWMPPRMPDPPRSDIGIPGWFATGHQPPWFFLTAQPLDPNRFGEPLPLPVRPEVWTISYEVDAS